MAKRAKAQPRCIIIAGPNGAGKTTFARNYLLKDAGIENFVNADSIAAGLSPLKPERAARAAGRLLLQEIERLATAGESFALESTLSGSTYRDRLNRLKDLGYRIEIIFLRLNNPELAIKRVALRVKQGGHHVPEDDVRRRFTRGLHNFEVIYKPLAHRWSLYENSGATPVLIESRS
jgi:predicted ABC-type ATPase